MTANIRVGLAAGECVGAFPGAPRPSASALGTAHLAAALIACLFVAGFWVNLPGPQADMADRARPVDLARAHVGSGRRSSDRALRSTTAF